MTENASLAYRAFITKMHAMSYVFDLINFRHR
jgi:hypothetical protein